MLDSIAERERGGAAHVRPTPNQSQPAKHKRKKADELAERRAEQEQQGQGYIDLVNLPC